MKMLRLALSKKTTTHKMMEGHEKAIRQLTGCETEIISFVGISMARVITFLLSKEASFSPCGWLF